MAENETDGVKGSFRQNQNNRKRREPPIIDATASEVTSPVPDPESGPAASPPQPAASPSNPFPDADKPETPASEEPVLFSQVLRGSPPRPGAKPEPAAARDGSADTVAASGTTPKEPGATTETGAPGTRPMSAQDLGLSGPGEPGGMFGTASAFGSDASDPVKPPPAGRSPLTMILAGVIALLLLAIAGLLFTDGRRGNADELKAALDAANGRLDALEARADPAPLKAEITRLDEHGSGLDAALAALKTSDEALTGRLDALASKTDESAARLAALQPPAASGDAATPPAPLATTGDTTALAARLDDLARKVDALPPPAPPADVAPIEARLDDLSRKVETLPPPAPKTDLAPLAARLDDLAHKVETLPPPAPPADVASLWARIDDLARKVEAFPPPAPAVDLNPLRGKVDDLTGRIDALQTSVAALPKVDLGPLDKRVGDVDGRVAEFAAALAALPRPDVEPLKAGLAAVDGRLAPIEAALSAPKAGDRTTEARAVGSADEARAAPLAVVAQEAGRGIEDGRPILSEVEALRALGVEEAALTPLAAVAEKGAPTLASLKTGWAEIEPQVLATTRPSSESLLDRFAAGARQIVTVRRVGAPAGEDPASVAGRVSSALAGDDLAGALAEWNALPEAGRTLSQAWADQARVRLDAEAAAKALASGAIESLAKSKG